MTSYKSQILKIIFLFISFVLTTFILGGFILNGLLRVQAQLANILVIVAIFFITWKAYKKEGKNLSALGLNLKLKKYWFCIFGICCRRTIYYSSCVYNCIYKKVILLFLIMLLKVRMF